MLVLDQRTDPARVHSVRKDRRLVISKTAPIHSELPLKVARSVSQDFASGVLFEGARGWIKSPAWLLRYADKLVLAGRAVLSQKENKGQKEKLKAFKAFKGPENEDRKFCRHLVLKAFPSTRCDSTRSFGSFQLPCRTARAKVQPIPC